MLEKSAEIINGAILRKINNTLADIGAIWQNTDQNGNTYETLMLKRTFNPAGLDAKDGADSIRVSLFKPKLPQKRPARTAVGL